MKLAPPPGKAGKKIEPAVPSSDAPQSDPNDLLSLDEPQQKASEDPLSGLF